MKPLSSDGPVHQCKAFYQALFNSANDGIFVMSKDQFVECNPKVLEMFKVTEDEILGHTPFEFSPDFQPDGTKSEIAAKKKINAAIKGKPQHFEWLHKKSDDTLFYCEISLNRIQLSDNVWLQAIVRDVTENREAESLIKESETKYRSLIETTSTGYTILNECGEVLEANSEYVRMTGHRSLDEIIGHPVVEWTADYDQERNHQEVIKCMEKGFVRHLRIDYQGPEGRVVPIEINATVIDTETGKQILTICHDVTDQKQREDELIDRLNRIQKQEKSIVKIITASCIAQGDIENAIALITGEISATLNVARVGVHYLGNVSLNNSDQRCYLHANDHCQFCELFEVEHYPKYLKALQRERSIVAYNVNLDPRISELVDDYFKPNKIQSVLSVPIRISGELIGVLNIEHIESNRSWQPDEITYSAEMTDQITQTILNQQKIETEKALRESEEQYRKIFEMIPESVMISDVNGVISTVNAHAARVYGYTQEEMVGMSIEKLLHPDHRHKLKDVLIDIHNGIPLHVNSIDIDKNGEIIFSEVFASQIQLHGKNYSLAVIRDITEQKRILDELKQSEDKFKNILESSPDAIGVIDLEGNFIECNKALEQLHGYTREELLNMKGFDLIVPEYHKEAKAFLQNIEKGEKVSQLSFELLRKSNEKFFSEMSVSVLNDALARPVALIVITKDISERIEAERIIQESEFKFRSIFNSLPIGMFIYHLEDNNLVFKDYNPSAEQILGVSCSGFYNKTLEELFPALAATDVPDAYRRTAKYGELYHQEDIYYSENDIIGNFDVYAFQYSQNQIVVAFNNITEKKKFDEALKLSEERYRQVVDNATEAIFIVQDMKLVFVNAMMTKIFGYSAEELLVKTGPELIHPEDLPMIIDKYQKRLQGIETVPQYLFRATNKKGDVLWVENNAVLIQWDDRPAILNFLNDITDRRIAENKLKASERRYRDLFVNLRDGVRIVDLKGQYLDANPAYSDLVGYSLDELNGLSYKNLTPKRWAESEAKQVKKIVKQGYSDLYEKEIIHKDGHVIPVELRSYLMRNDEGKGIAMVGVARDITERKKNQDLMMMAERAERLASLGTLAAGIAHEINQPLTALKVKVDGLLYWGIEKPEILQRNLIENLKFVSDEAEKISEIVKHMRSLVRQEKTSTPDLVALNKVVTRGISMIQRKLMSMRIELILHLDDTNPVILAHANPVERVVINLLMNAANALSKTHKKKKQVIIKTFIEKDNSVLQVIDNGPGIAEAYLPYIFDPFYTTSEGGEGMGLGLSIIQNIISSYGGTIRVQNGKRSGAIFTVKLPLANEN